MSEYEKSLVNLFPKTGENPKRLKITSYKKIGDRTYEISFDKDICSISVYDLVRRDD